MFDLMLAKRAKDDALTNLAGNSRYVLEPKMDGMRVAVKKRGDKVTIYSRTHHTQAGKVPHLEDAFRAFDYDFDIDGEVIALDRLVDVQGTLAPLGDFNFTMRVMGSDAHEAVRKQTLAKRPLVFFAFDIMTLNGADLRDHSEADRRNVLAGFVERLATPYVGLLPRFAVSEDAYADYIAAGGEGMMLKDTRAPYVGKRRAAWQKVKVEHTLDAVITGFKPGQGKFSDTIGALLFSQYDANGNLVERGACSGMDDATRYAIGNDQSAYVGRVIEVKHFGLVTEADVDGLRHPVFVRFRDDKAPVDCTME